MSGLQPVFQQLSPVTLSLGELYLDPNNPRLVSFNHEIIAADRIDDAEVQDDVRSALIEKCSIRRLQDNMEVNGYLPIDRVIVKQFKDSKYVVLEGNRRICAAKLIVALKGQTDHIEDAVFDSLESIPCLVYSGEEEDAAWIFQGIRHISGFLDWGAFQKAKILVDQKEAEGLSLTEVGKRFGLSAHGAGQWMRGYYAFMQASQESEYTEVIDDKIYPFINELFSQTSAPIREWMEWNENDSRFNNLLLYNEFISWFFPSEIDPNGVPLGPGKWEDRRLDKRDHIRYLAYLRRHDNDLFEAFRSAKSDVEQLYNISQHRKYDQEKSKVSDAAEETMIAIESCTKALHDAPARLFRPGESFERFKSSLVKMNDEIQSIREAYGF